MTVSVGFPYDGDPHSTGQYDDAWQTSGWTAQNMAYPPDSTGVVPPDGIYPIDIVGSFFVAEGRPISGVFNFEPETKQMVIGGKSVTFERHKEYMKRGELKVRLYIPIDSPFIYHVRQRVGPVNREYDITLDSTMTTFDISSL